ncbi:hypothetical protein TRAPUB_4887 [Trametes pubescens]|uniref:Uncharacterized protein n=1 Tax=Trametes pubescens TaxID=154538 RepID=A0A1M2V9W3_TRAPU|nr:hypothetical protein TRAPUB_4887 [Trametes pubescens]
MGSSFKAMEPADSHAPVSILPPSRSPQGRAQPTKTTAVAGTNSGSVAPRGAF